MRNIRGQFVKGCKRLDITGKNNPRWRGGPPDCTVCGRKLFNYDAKLCVYHRTAGENNNNWKGGISKQKGYESTIQQNREARKKGNGGSYSIQEWNELKEKFNYMCLCCKRCEPEITLTADHILPISKGGRNDISNLQPLCKSCNSRKFTKHIDYISQYYEVKEIKI